MAVFRIAVAQVASVLGDIELNVTAHATSIEAAARHGVSVLVFPELSLTGYDPGLAASLATGPEDPRLIPLRTLAREHRMAVVVGAPLASGSGAKPALGVILFDGANTPRCYAKMHLGGNERTFFEPGETPLCFESGGRKIGIAICADTAQPSHPRFHAASGAAVYAAGVFLNADWADTDLPRFPAIAKRHRMLVAIANHGSSVGTLVSIGRSAVWGHDGELLAQAEDVEDCLIVAVHRAGAWSGEVVRI